MSAGIRASRALWIAVEVEARKFAAARVPVGTTLLLVVGVTAIATGMTLAARSGDPAVTAKLGPAAQLEGWDQLVTIVLQVTAAASVVAFGLALSWTMGREFADGTVTGLFALPVPRQVIAAGKLLVYLMWTVGVAVCLVVVVAVVGLALRLAPPSSGSLPLLLARLAALVVLSGLIAAPAAWAATLGRGLMAGIGTTVALMATAQFVAISGSGAWFPFTAPALWAMNVGPVSAVQLALVATVPALFGALTLRAWATLQLDR
jgi:ABC-2 type transport system permease protein